MSHTSLYLPGSWLSVLLMMNNLLRMHGLFVVGGRTDAKPALL